MRTKKEYNEYQRIYQANRFRRRKAAAINQLGGCCVVCGSDEKLEFDHIDPQSKLYTIGMIFTHSETKLQSELLKCQLLCKSHHLEKTISQQSVDHGGGLTGKRNCRCSLCAPLKNKYQKRYK